MDRPTLYWISGSPPAWRVMLGLVLKGISFDSKRLDHGAGENQQRQYLALNPKGQVPTLITGDVVMRESIAILAWLDRAWPQRPIWGGSASEAARVWQDVMIMESDLRPAVTATAQGLLRGNTVSNDIRATLAKEADTLNTRLNNTPFLGGAQPMAADVWLYPAIHWIARGVALASNQAFSEARDLTKSRPALDTWAKRMAALPGVADTYPPHWPTPLET